mmetsp:Transcript_37246/g.44912  ORF Transcript_37246/g.44912 Transcript_37246/m.44912 type:complete len:456 (+) Transcript_37246:48-1415(+)
MKIGAMVVRMFTSASIVRAYSAAFRTRLLATTVQSYSAPKRLGFGGLVRYGSNPTPCLPRPLFVRGGATVPSSSLSSSAVEPEPTTSDYGGILGTLQPSTFGSLPYLYSSTKTTSTTTTKSNHKVLFILGGPGAGKGTQCANLVSKYRCVHLSAGDLLRAAKEDTTNVHSALISECLVQGKIVPVEISLGLLSDAMDAAVSKPAPGTVARSEYEREERYGAPIFLIDGFPRNFDNLQGWCDIMPHSGTSLLGTLVFDCPVEILQERILSRGETSGRTDDNLVSARKRFDTFVEQTCPVVEALEREVRECKTVHIDGSNGLEEVWAETQNIMDGFVTNDVLSANSDLLTAIRSEDWEGYRALVAPDMISPEVDDTAPSTTTPPTPKVTPQSMEVIPNLQREDPVSNAVVEIMGTTATVSYDRTFVLEDGSDLHFREMRTWRHVNNGWIMVHFTRKQ